MKKWSILVALVMVLGFVGCSLDKPLVTGGGSSSSAPAVGDVYVTNQILTTDGYYTNGAFDSALPSAIFQPVFANHPNHNDNGNYLGDGGWTINEVVGANINMYVTKNLFFTNYAYYTKADDTGLAYGFPGNKYYSVWEVYHFVNKTYKIYWGSAYYKFYVELKNGNTNAIFSTLDSANSYNNLQ